VVQGNEDSFEILTQDPLIIQAPISPSANGLCDKLGALTAKELKAYLTRSHAMVAAGLPKKVQTALGLNPNLSSPAEPA